MTGSAVLVNCTPSYSGRRKDQWRQAYLVARPRPPVQAAMVKFASEPSRIKPACRVANTGGQQRSNFGLRRARFQHAAGVRRRQGVGDGELRHRHARRARFARRFHPHALCQSRCAERRSAAAGHPRYVRQPQPIDRPGPRRAANQGLCGREPDGPGQRRGFHALWSVGKERGDRRFQELCHLPSRSQGALLGRTTG